MTPRSPYDLPASHRSLVLWLWAGFSPKQVAQLMNLRYTTVREKVAEVGRQLPGQNAPLHKILLWKAEYWRDLIISDPTCVGLPAKGGTS
jgi:hypothetical protein